MRLKLIGIIIAAGLLVLLSGLQPLQGLRQFIERSLVLPLRVAFLPELKPVESLRILSLQEELQQLKTENQIMRQQLGAIPEKSRLVPVKVISQSEYELVASYSSLANNVLVNKPVVLGEVFLGKVARQSPTMLVIKMPVGSGFIGEGITNNNLEGKIKGQFNNQVIFETSVEKRLKKGQAVYFLDKENGWRFLIGKISQINKDQRLTLQQAMINYQANQVQLQTIFVVN